MPAIHDNSIYVPGPPVDGVIYKLDALTGDTIWSHTTVGAEVQGVAVGNGMVYFGYFHYWGGPFGIRAICASACTTIWDYPDPNHGFSVPALSEDNTRLVSSRQDKVYCFNALTGDTIWTYDAGALWGVHLPSIVDTVVYAYYGGPAGNWAFALNLSNGHEI